MRPPYVKALAPGAASRHLYPFVRSRRATRIAAGARRMGRQACLPSCGRPRPALALALGDVQFARIAASARWRWARAR